MIKTICINTMLMRMDIKKSELKKFIFIILIYNIRVRAKVAMRTNGLKRRQTYEEVIEYIKNDKDKN